MTTNELIIKINEALVKEGFTNDTPFWEKKFWHKDGKYSNDTQLGMTIEVNVVYRHNGTEENKSVDLTLRNWTQTGNEWLPTGHCITNVRLNVNMSERQINNRIAKIIAQY